MRLVFLGSATLPTSSANRVSLDWTPYRLNKRLKIHVEQASR